MVEGKIINKINRGKNSSWINKEIIDTAIETRVNLLHNFTLGTPNINSSSSTSHYDNSSSRNPLLLETPATTTQNKQNQNIKDTDNLTDETLNQIQAHQLKEEALVQAEEAMNRTFETEFLNFKLKCEKSVYKSYRNYNTHIKNLEKQIQNKDKMIENLLYTIKVHTSYKGSPDIAVHETRVVSDFYLESFNVPLVDNNVDHNVSVSNEVDNLNSVIEDEMCCDDPTTYPLLRAISKYKNQHGVCNKKMNAGIA